MGRILLPRNIEVVIASAGGAGTTFLLSYIAQFKKANHPGDADGLKHSPLPPFSFNRNVKFVYVFGNPQLAAISLFRRNFQHYQSIKLQKWGKRKTSPIPKDMVLHEYASQGIDKFYFRNHFYNWYDKYLAVCPTMFIRYETLFDNVALLLDFLDLPKDCIDSFPRKKTRTSTTEQVPADTIKRLDHMYGDFSDELARLNDVTVRKRKNHKTFSRTHARSPYLNALAEQPAFEAKEFLKKHVPKMHTVLRKMKQRTNRLA